MIATVLIVLLLVASGVLFWTARRGKKSQAVSTKAAADTKKSRDDDFMDEDVLARLRARAGGMSSFNYNILRYVGIGTLILAFVVSFTNTFTTIPTKDIGVKVAFGAPVGSLPNGAHFKAPWEDVTLMDGAIQTDTHNKADGNSCVQVRIAHQIVACADMYVKWQVKEKAVDNLFQNYREFENIRDALVNKNLQAVLNHVFEGYDPLAVDVDGNASAPQLAVLSKTALDQMVAAVGDRINVQELNVTVLNYNPATQQKIDALQAQVAQTRIAQQSIKTNDAQAQANAKLAKSVSQNPNVLVSQCIDSLNEAIAKSYQLPAGFSCWPGGSSAVVVPGTTQK